MGYHITIVDRQENTAETVYFSAFLPRRHRHWYAGDPLDCFCYFHDGVQKLGGPDTDDFSGEWEPDWDWCLKMAWRMVAHVSVYDPTSHPSYSEDRAAEVLGEKMENDRALYEQIATACEQGAAEPGRFVVRMSY